VASVLFLAVCAQWQSVPGVIYELRGPWRFLGWTAQVAGIALTMRASAALDVLDLSGVRAVTRPVGGPAVVPQPLTTRGLYAFVRHPLYFAWTLFVFGAPMMTSTRGAFAIISTAYLMLAIPLEERGLVATYGEGYRAYRRKVKTRMIPWVY
jgi:methanethiol S-methyltransferase